jgi:hypothetical protein
MHLLNACMCVGGLHETFGERIRDICMTVLFVGSCAQYFFFLSDSFARAKSLYSSNNQHTANIMQEQDVNVYYFCRSETTGPDLQNDLKS